MKDGTAYLMILNSIKCQNGLIHGKLHNHGEHCAIGSYFHLHNNTALPESLIDEVAAVNDSLPNASPKIRKREVMRWLKWKLDQLGFPGMKPANRK